MKTLFILFALVSGLFALEQAPTNYDKVRPVVTLDAVTDSVLVTGQGYGTAGFQVTGTWAGTIQFYSTINGTDWVGAYATNSQSRASDTTTTENGLYYVGTSGARYIKAKFSAYTSGAAVVNAITTDDPIATTSAGGGGGAEGSVDVLSIAAGNNNIGNVDVVTLPALVAGTANIGDVDVLSLPATPAGNNNIGDVDVATIAAGDNNIGNVDIVTMPTVTVNAHAVTNAGTFATQAAQSGTWTVQPGNTANTTAWKVDGSAVTQPISGTVTANAGTGTMAVSLASVPSHAVTNAGTFPVQVDGAALTALQLSDDVVGATGSAVPAKASYAGAVSSGNLTGLIQADASVKIDVGTATTTEIVALTSTQKIYVTSWDVISAGTGTIKLVYGTGTACGTGTTDLTGAYSLIAQAGLAKGNGLGPVLVVPASNALCVTTSAAVGMQGSVAYTKF